MKIHARVTLVHRNNICSIFIIFRIIPLFPTLFVISLSNHSMVSHSFDLYHTLIN